MTKLFLLRHGESEWNVLKRVQGQSNPELTDRGLRQAKRAAKRLKDENIDVIYSSDLKRACNTAKTIGKELNIKVDELCGIREMHFGTWEGLDLATIERDHHDHYKSWRTEPHNIEFDNGESLLTVQERALKDVRNLVAKNENKNILLVSHGTAIKTIILGLLDIDISKYSKMSIGNVGLSIIEFREFSEVLTLLNDTSHAKGV